jgi:hypothetical protein
MTTQYSLSYCGPCKVEALRFAKMPNFNGPNPTCPYQIIVVDGKLDSWQNLISNGQNPEDQTLVKFIMDHSKVGNDPSPNGKGYPRLDAPDPNCQLQ